MQNKADNCIHGFTLIEAIISIIIVSTMFLAAMNLYTACNINNASYASKTIQIAAINQTINAVDLYLFEYKGEIADNITVHNNDRSSRLTKLNNYEDIISISTDMPPIKRQFSVNAINLNNNLTFGTTNNLYAITIKYYVKDSLIKKMIVYRQSS